MSELNTPETQESISESGIPEVTFTLQLSEVVQAPIDATLSIAGQAADAKATGDAINDAKAALQDEIDDLEDGIGLLAGQLFPVGSVYCSISSTAPTFGAASWVWQEILIPTTWGDLEDGSRSYADRSAGDSAGTLHFWRRTA